MQDNRMDSTSEKMSTAATTSTSTSTSEISTEETRNQFKLFDIVTDYSDHYYAVKNQQSSNNADFFTSAGSAVGKKIMKEWKILEENLPDSISVRVYEGRIDLLRFVIVGAPGTPYHDGLFFFDLAFPSNYPSQPPKVYYRSHGLRLNPNLYSNGYVCLSLLNTWTGKKEERWNPSSSTILQVLVSIQGLVLNAEPYYNEPGLKPAPNSTAYNEKVFLLSCKTMQYVIQNPPKNFKDIVARHFCDRANGILRACEAYMNGNVKVGFYLDDKTSFPPAKIKVWRTYKAGLKKQYLLLAAAFTKIGASVEKPEPTLMIDKKKKKKEEIGKRNNEHGIGYKIISKFKICLGLKKDGDDVKNNAKSS